MSVCKRGSVLTYSPLSPLLTPQDISPVDFYCITIQQIWLSPSFSPSHPTTMFSHAGKLRSMHKSELQMLTEEAGCSIRAFWRMEVSDGKVVAMFLVVLWNGLKKYWWRNKIVQKIVSLFGYLDTVSDFSNCSFSFHWTKGLKVKLSQ